MSEEVPPPPSPWAAAVRSGDSPGAPEPSQGLGPPPSSGQYRHETLVSVGLGMLCGGGAVLLLGALAIMLS